VRSSSAERGVRFLRRDALNSPARLLPRDASHHEGRVAQRRRKRDRCFHRTATGCQWTAAENSAAARRRAPGAAIQSLRGVGTTATTIASPVRRKTVPGCHARRATGRARSERLASSEAVAPAPDGRRVPPLQLRCRPRPVEACFLLLDLACIGCACRRLRLGLHAFRWAVLRASLPSFLRRAPPVVVQLPASSSGAIGRRRCASTGPVSRLRPSA